MVTALLSFIILAITTYGAHAIEGTSTECATTNFFQARISDGTKAARVDWPFLAAIFLVEENQFFCGGSLISSKHVLTAAHCIQNKDSQSKLLPGDIIVLLGAYDISLSIERGRQQRDVAEIRVHPEWNVNSEKYDADVAILLLGEIVIFTNYIQPVGLPADNDVIENVSGSVVGWGLTETGTGPNREFIKHAFVTALNHVYCLTTYPDTAVISSVNTFCGRGENGQPNMGDSGGGFYVQNKQCTWLQHGVVSALRFNENGLVNVVVYTNVLKYKDWIVDAVRQSGATVIEGQTNAEIKINLECRFGYDPDNEYSCYVHNLDIQTENINVASFTGSHDNGKTDQDVTHFYFDSGKMFFLPSGVGNYFKNLSKLQVTWNLNTKLIKRSDLQNLESLPKIHIFGNDIELLEFDSLWDLPALETFLLTDNKLFKMLHERTFEKNVRLTEVYLWANSLEYLPRDIFKANVLLQWVDLSRNSLRKIETDFSTLRNIGGVYLDVNACINLNYLKDISRVKNTFRDLTNLSEFQSQIMSNCSM